MSTQPRALVFTLQHHPLWPAMRPMFSSLWEHAHRPCMIYEEKHQARVDLFSRFPEPDCTHDVIAQTTHLLTLLVHAGIGPLCIGGHLARLAPGARRTPTLYKTGLHLGMTRSRMVKELRLLGFRVLGPGRVFRNDNSQLYNVLWSTLDRAKKLEPQHKLSDEEGWAILTRWLAQPERGSAENILNGPALQLPYSEKGQLKALRRHIRAEELAAFESFVEALKHRAAV